MFVLRGFYVFGIGITGNTSGPSKNTWELFQWLKRWSITLDKEKKCAYVLLFLTYFLVSVYYIFIKHFGKSLQFFFFVFDMRP